MKLKKTYSIQIPISKEEYDTEQGKVTEAVEAVANSLGLEIVLVETIETEV